MVSVTIVTWNSAAHLQECLASLRAQDYPCMEVVIVDNASSDETRAILNTLDSAFRVIFNDANVGFAAGQNQAIREARGDWILCLNPDIVMSREFVRMLIAAGERYPDAGGVCGKLLRWNPNGEPHATDIIDSTGIYFTPNMRHLDRGAEERDRGQYERTQYVFGASGAAVLFRREFIQDVLVEGEFFDQEFFSFREDGDLAWRAQVLGWKYLYTPSAVAWHVRRVTPERRSELPLVVNWHSVKNRWLMRAKNASGWLCWRLMVPVLVRDVAAWGHALVRDRRMISACLYRWRPDVRERLRRKRAEIQSRRKVSDHELLWWFSNAPQAIDAETEPPVLTTGSPVTHEPNQALTGEQR